MAELEDESTSADSSAAGTSTDETEQNIHTNVTNDGESENKSEIANEYTSNNENIVSAETRSETARDIAHGIYGMGYCLTTESNSESSSHIVVTDIEESGALAVNTTCSSSSLSTNNVADSFNVNLNTRLLTSSTEPSENPNYSTDVSDALSKLTHGDRINLIISGSQVHDVSQNTKRHLDMLSDLTGKNNNDGNSDPVNELIISSQQQHSLPSSDTPIFTSSVPSLISPTGSDSTVVSANLFDTPQLQTFLLALQPHLAADHAADISTSTTQTIIQNILKQNILTNLQQVGVAVDSHGDNTVSVVRSTQDQSCSQSSENPLMALGIASQNDDVMLSQEVGSNVHSSEVQLMNSTDLTNLHEISNTNILNTLQAEMIAVEVLTGEPQSNQVPQSVMISQSGQSPDADETGTVNLVQSQSEQGTPMYTLQIGGQTIPFTTIQLPASQASALAEQGAAIQITTSGAVIGGEGTNENMSSIGSLSNEPQVVTSSSTLPSLSTILLPGTPSKSGTISQASSEGKSKYTCEICGKSYVRSWSYYGHMREHAAGERSHKCEECGKVFSYASNLKQHLLSHSGLKPYECELCDKAFGNPSSLRIHILSHSEDKPYICEYDACDKAFSNPSSLRVHQRVHQTEKPYRCNYQGCDLAFKTASELSRHTFRHTGEKPHRCNKCSKSFVRYDDLKRHYFIHTGEKPFRCNQCDFSCIQSFDLVKHRYTHGGDKPYKCEHCPKQFTRPARLRDHMRLHTGEKPFKCEECGKSFTQQTSLKSHKLNHSGEKPFKCDQCHKSFKSHGDLKSHSNNHTGLRPYSCELCGKDFISSKTLHRHAVVHSGDKPFECTECSRKFARASDLKIHLPVHSEDKPYKCDQCEKMFTRYSSLKEHIRTHTGEFPFKCDQCEKIFNHRSHLNTHIRTHTGEKPFKCDICSKEFARKTSLRYHTRVHTENGATKHVGRPRKSILDNDSNDYSSVGSIDSHGMEIELGDDESEDSTSQRPGKRKREDDPVETGDERFSEKRMATEQQVMASAVEAMRLMANFTSGDGQLHTAADSQSGIQSNLNESNPVIMQFAPGQIPIVTSQGTAVVTLDLSGLQGTEGQVVETLVQLQGLEANLENLASRALLNHAQRLTVGLDGSVEIPMSHSLIQQMQNADGSISLQVGDAQVAQALQTLQALQQQGGMTKQIDVIETNEHNSNNETTEKEEMIQPRISNNELIGVSLDASQTSEIRVKTETISLNTADSVQPNADVSDENVPSPTDLMIVTTIS